MQSYRGAVGSEIGKHKNQRPDLVQVITAKPFLTGIHLLNAMCGEVINSGPDYYFLFIPLPPPSKDEAQKLFWSVSAACPCVWGLRRGMFWEMSQLTECHPQLGLALTTSQDGKRKCIYATFNIFKVSKAFLKVLNFLFSSTTHQPTDL